ncbi:phage head completion protein [Massilia putida]|uniref:phage head completion protein n=1 Tax=Massilia putida TaxID=1141883 RepID=UPI0009524CEF|nr:head-tail adaptor protein [Massilia putida]
MSEALMLPDTGELNRRIVIRRWTDAPNASFNVDQTFDVGISRWAKVEPVRGIASRMGVTTGEEPTHFFWVRFSFETPAEYFAQDRVIEYRARRYRILDAQNFQDADRFIRITTKDLGAIDAMTSGTPTP